jgi:hypothetical protein
VIHHRWPPISEDRRYDIQVIYEQGRSPVSLKTAGKPLNSARFKQDFSSEISAKIGFAAKNITERNEHEEPLFV